MKRLTLLLAASITTSAVAAASAPSYRVESSIAGPDGGWDYARIDATAHRLYIARTTSVTVINTESNATIGSIGSFLHGHAVVPLSGGRLLVTSGDDASVRFLAATDGHELAKLSVGKKPDAAIVSADGRMAFVMNADDGTVSVIDVKAMKVTRTVMIKPGLEYSALTPGGTLFVNNEDANEMEVVDIARGTPPNAIAMRGCESPSGLAYDNKSGRLIAACANGKAAVVDARHKRFVGLVDIDFGPDAVILDPVRRLAFIPCGKDGILDILALDGVRVRRVGRVKTEVGARTGALDANTGAIYLPTATLEPPTKPSGRPRPVPGTFHVLVIRPV